MMFDQAIYRIMNAPVLTWPFPHIYVTDLFEDYRKFYSVIADNVVRTSWVPLNQTWRVTANYSPHRFVAANSAPFIRDRFPQLSLEHFGLALMSLFGFVNASSEALRDDHLLIEDRPGYSLGPHTDSPSKVISCLFYLAVDSLTPHLGTSFYIPKEPGFRCKGGPHYPFDRFMRVRTFPYVPNSMLAFVKSDVSFHGVESFNERSRQLLLYDIRRK